jgi:hypothetical protein
MMTFALMPLFLLLVLAGGLCVATLVIGLLAGGRLAGAGLLAVGLMFALGLACAGGLMASYQRHRARTVHAYAVRMEAENQADLRQVLQHEYSGIEFAERPPYTVELNDPARAATLPSPLARSAYAPAPVEVRSADDYAAEIVTADVDTADVDTADVDTADASTAESVESEAVVTESEADESDVDLTRTEPEESESKAEPSESEAADAEPSESEADWAEPEPVPAPAEAMATDPAAPADPLTAPAPEPVPTGDAPAPVSTQSAASPATAPVWVQQPPDRVDGQLAVVLVSDPFVDRFACDEDLERRTRDAILQAARQRCRQRGLPLDLALQITYDEIDIVSRERHYQSRATSLGDMIQGYQLTVMDDAFQAKLDKRIVDAMVDRRLATTGVFSGSVLLGVSLLFGVFRFAARKSPDPLRVG